MTERTARGYAKRLSEYFKHVGFEYLFASDAMEQEDLTDDAFDRIWNGYMRQVQDLREDTIAGRFTVEALRGAVRHHQRPADENEIVIGGAFSHMASVPR